MPNTITADHLDCAALAAKLEAMARGGHHTIGEVLASGLMDELGNVSTRQLAVFFEDESTSQFVQAPFHEGKPGSKKSTKKATRKGKTKAAKKTAAKRKPPTNGARSSQPAKPSPSATAAAWGRNVSDAEIEKWICVQVAADGITPAAVISGLGVPRSRVTRAFDRLVTAGQLNRVGAGRGTRYMPNGTTDPVETTAEPVQAAQSSNGVPAQA